MYLIAMRLASRATQKQSPGELAASTGTGASELRPKSACRRSACSVFVGRPVDGPPRWMSTITSGSSTMVARPIASVLSAIPGPEVVVIARWPPYAAPMADVIAAISSSAWNVTTPNSFSIDSSCRMSEAGVIG